MGANQNVTSKRNFCVIHSRQSSKLAKQGACGPSKTTGTACCFPIYLPNLESELI